MRYFIAVAAALVLIAGCSSSGGHRANSAPPPRSTASSAPAKTSSTSTESTATTAQFASIVAAGETRVDHTARGIAECGYEYDPMDLTCTLGRMTYALAVETLSVNLEGALRPSAPHYLGRPPAELTDVITSTRAALHRMKTAEAARQRRCGARDTGACDRAIFDWVSAQDDVDAALAAWKPYGG
jgi:hypothetical protein